MKRVLAVDAFVAEMEAAILALKVADKQSLEKVVCEGDALNVVRALNGKRRNGKLVRY